MCILSGSLQSPPGCERVTCCLLTFQVPPSNGEEASSGCECNGVTGSLWSDPCGREEPRPSAADGEEVRAYKGTLTQVTHHKTHHVVKELVTVGGHYKRIALELVTFILITPGSV